MQGESAFWKQKMRTHHYAIDVNKDGTVSWDDFDEMAKRFAKLGYLTAEQQASFVGTLRVRHNSCDLLFAQTVE